MDDPGGELEQEAALELGQSAVRTNFLAGRCGER
jgi:hypothetical protein